MFRYAVRQTSRRTAARTSGRTASSLRTQRYACRRVLSVEMARPSCLVSSPEEHVERTFNLEEDEDGT
jgi:hypothetical protein